MSPYSWASAALMMIAVAVLVDPLAGLAGVEGEDLLEEVAHPDDFLGLDFDVDGLASRVAVGLVSGAVACHLGKKNPFIGER